MKKTTSFIKILLLLLIPGYGCSVHTENLLVNGGAELPAYDSVPNGWDNIAGKWSSLEGDSTHHDYGYAKDGNHYFFGGYGLTCILQQDVDVLKYAKDIDGQKQKFVISGYERTLDQGPLSDQGMVKFECLDASKSKIFYSDSTDTLMSIGKWQAIADTFLAPQSTRFVRVQLVAFRHVGGDNDGYFDDFRLSASPSRNYALIFIIIIALAAVAGATMYFRKKDKQ
jgi:hypothetical protein